MINILTMLKLLHYGQVGGSIRYMQKTDQYHPAAVSILWQFCTKDFWGKANLVTEISAMTSSATRYDTKWLFQPNQMTVSATTSSGQTILVMAIRPAARLLASWIHISSQFGIRQYASPHIHQLTRLSARLHDRPAYNVLFSTCRLFVCPLATRQRSHIPVCKTRWLILPSCRLPFGPSVLSPASAPLVRAPVHKSAQHGNSLHAFFCSQLGTCVLLSTS